MDDLETHATGFDDPEASGDSRGGKLSLLALVVGLAGVGLGIGGLYLANRASSELQAYQAAVAGQADPVADELAAFRAEVAAQIDDIDGRLGNIGGSIVRLQRQGSNQEVAKQLQDFHQQTQQAFQSVSQEVQKNRARLNSQAEQVETLLQRVASGGTVARRSEPAREAVAPGGTGSAESASGQGAESVPGEGIIHRVQPGETMSSIAKRYGISLGQLMNANPGVEARRMQIGQELVIPGSSD